MNTPPESITAPSRLRAAIALRRLLPLCILSSVPSASAFVLFEDNFDGYANQAAFEEMWEPVTAGASGTLSTDPFVSAPNSINFATTAQRNQTFFDGTGVPGTPDSEFVIRFSLDFYDSDAAASPYRQYATLQDSTSAGASGQLIALGLNNNLLSTAEGGNFYMARILGFNGNAFFKLNDDPALLRTTGWHNLAVEITTEAFRFFVDGSLAETVSAEGITARSYNVVRIGSGLSSLQASNIDNVRVELVPEPSTALLLGVGIAAIGLRRRSGRSLS